MLLLIFDGEPILKEPDKCEGWAWYNLNNFPRGLWDGMEKMVKNYYAI